MSFVLHSKLRGEKHLGQERWNLYKTARENPRRVLVYEDEYESLEVGTAELTKRLHVSNPPYTVCTAHLHHLPASFTYLEHLDGESTLYLPHRCISTESNDAANDR